MLKKYFSLWAWIFSLIFIGSMIGMMTASQIPNWYNHLARSSLTPPDYVFGIAWTILYAMIGYCGWLIWQTPDFSDLKQIKVLFILQLLFNWAWTPLFFKMHFITLALICLILIIVLVSTLIYLSLIHI